MEHNSIPFSFKDYNYEKKDFSLNSEREKKLNEAYRNKINRFAIHSIQNDQISKKEKATNFKINIYESNITKKFNEILLQVSKNMA